MNEPNTKRIEIPIKEISSINVGDHIDIHGRILCGRDAVLPRICKLIEEDRLDELDVNLTGSAIFHTAVSQAGFGPTSSNKLEIENSFKNLCEAGVKVFLGKGQISPTTIELLHHYGAIFALVPPVSALLSQNLISQRCVKYEELGMEALYELTLASCPSVVAVANGKDLFYE